MAEIKTIPCTLTEIGLRKAQEAANHEGFFIHPISFGVSDIKGILSYNRDTEYSMWYEAPISVYEIINTHTVAFYCDIPPDASNINQIINEIYLFARDGNEKYLLCLGQVNAVTHVPGIATQIKIIVSLIQYDVATIYKFEDSAATSIEQHNIDSNAHAELFSRLNARNVRYIVAADMVQNITLAQTNDVILANSNKVGLTVFLPDSAPAGAQVTIIDQAKCSSKYFIIIRASDTIDDNNSFIINSDGAKVTFTFDERHRDWIPDIGGMLFNKGGNYYSSYLSNGLPVYTEYDNYAVNSIVAYNGQFYKSNIANGPDYSLIATPGTTNIWTLISNTYSRTEFLGCLKDTLYRLNGFYVKGNNDVKVYIDGILATEETYYEDKNVPVGTLTRNIYFYDDIPNTFMITVTT